MSTLSGRSKDWQLWRAVGLSLLLHLLLAALLISQPWRWQKAEPPPPVLAEFIIPEPPKPLPQKAPEPVPVPLPELPPPSVPQLQQAPLAERSTAPPSPGEQARNAPPKQAAPQPKAAPNSAQRGPAPKPADEPRRQSPSRTGNREAGREQAAGPAGEAMTQSESDFFLSQIVAAWVIDFRAPQFRDIQVYGRYKVLENGMLAPPFGKDDPWDIHAMVENWEEIENEPRAAAFRTAIETFLRAMRLAQPFAMPPNAEGYPKVLSLNFRIGDL